MTRGISKKRELFKALGTAALAGAAAAAAQTSPARPFRMPAEGRDTPKICLGYATRTRRACAG